jgi:hypothetical protein
VNIGKAMRIAAILAVVVLLAVAWYSTRGDALKDSVARATTPVAYQQPSDDTNPAAHGLVQAKAHADARADAREVERARRDAMYERILERQKQHSRHTGAPASPGGADADPATRRDDDAEADAGMKNRMGPEHEETVQAINRELVPLVDECIELARARNQASAPSARHPTTGMLAIAVSAIGDEEVGSVVEAVDFPEDNELSDPDLLECVRESSLAMSLPPPPSGGRTDFMITMRVDDE